MLVTRVHHTKLVWKTDCVGWPIFHSNTLFILIPKISSRVRFQIVRSGSNSGCLKVHFACSTKHLGIRAKNSAHQTPCNNYLTTVKADIWDPTLATWLSWVFWIGQPRDQWLDGGLNNACCCVTGFFTVSSLRFVRRKNAWRLRLGWLYICRSVTCVFWRGRRWCPMNPC